MTETEWPVLKSPRPRRYVAPWALAMLRPVMRHSSTRDAYVLRLVGNRWGPVVRQDRRTARRSRQQLVTD